VLKDFLPMPPDEGPPLPRGLGQRWPGKENKPSDLQRAEQIIHDLIAEIEDKITSSTDPVEISALKGAVFFIEDNWDALMNEIEWRPKV